MFRNASRSAPCSRDYEEESAPSCSRSTRSCGRPAACFMAIRSAREQTRTRAVTERRLDRGPCQVLERSVTGHAGHPLHDVEPAEPSAEHEVPSFSQIVRLQRVERELGRIEVPGLEVTSVDLAQDGGQTPEVGLIGRRDDGEVLGRPRDPCAPTANPPIRTYSTPPSASAAISSSGANIRVAAQIRCELRGQAAQSHRLLKSLGHRALQIPAAILGSRRLIATDPTPGLRPRPASGRDRTRRPRRPRHPRVRVRTTSAICRRCQRRSQELRAFRTVPSGLRSAWTCTFVIPSATTWVRSAISRPSSNRQADVVQPAGHQLAQRGARALDEQLRAQGAAGAQGRAAGEDRRRRLRRSISASAAPRDGWCSGRRRSGP